MKKRNSVNIRNVWAIVASVAMLSASVAQAVAVIYEPFADSDATLTGNTPGTGLSNTWAASENTYTVASPSLFFGPLAVTGNSATRSDAGRGGNYITTGTVDDNSLKAAGLLDTGATLWFSFLWKIDDIYDSNARGGFAFGTSNLRGVNGLNLGAAGSAFGMVEDLGSFYASKWGPGTDTYSSSAAVSWGTRTSPKLIVGKITWATDSGSDTNDTIEIYTPGIDLALPASPVCSNSAAFDQSLFNTIAFASKANGFPQIDEIRFGANYADVVPVETVAPTLLPADIVDDKNGGPIYEDVEIVTYTLTFDKHMDLSTITSNDFDHVGTAPATIGTVTQPSPAVISVQLLPTSTGTLRLRIPAGSILSSYVPLNLDTASAILDDTTITINSGVTPVAGTLYWDGPTISGVTDGASQGGTATWDTSTTNWDMGPGYEGPFAWNNSSSLSAVFGGTAGTVTLTENMNVSNVTITAKPYIIQGGSLTFPAGGSINYTLAGGTNWETLMTIKSAISNSPSVVLNGGGNSEHIFEPTSGTTSLGAVSGGGMIHLSGSTTGNTIASADLNKIRVTGGEWTLLGNARAFQHWVNDGTLIVDVGATLHATDSKGINLSTNATLVVNGTAGDPITTGISFAGSGEGASPWNVARPGGTLTGTGVVNQNVDLNVLAQATVAPGYPTGTLTITNGNVTIAGTLAIVIDGEECSRLLVDGVLDISAVTSTLDVNIAGASGREFIIATFDSMTGSAFAATNNLPSSWQVVYEATQIKLIPPPSGTLFILR